MSIFTALGKVIIDGKQYPLTAIRLLDGCILLEWMMHGPCEPFTSPVTVVGEDGQGLWQGLTFELVRPIPPGASWVFQYKLRIRELSDHPVERI